MNAAHAPPDINERALQAALDRKVCDPAAPFGGVTGQLDPSERVVARMFPAANSNVEAGRFEPFRE